MSVTVQLMSGEIISVSIEDGNFINTERFRYLLGSIIKQDPNLITLFLKSDENEFTDLSFCEKLRPGDRIYAIIRDRENFYFRRYNRGFKLFFKDGDIVKNNTYIPQGSNIYVEIDTYWPDLRIVIMNYRMRMGYYPPEEYDRHLRALGNVDAVESYINDILKIDTPECNICF